MSGSDRRIAGVPAVLAACTAIAVAACGERPANGRDAATSDAPADSTVEDPASRARYLTTVAYAAPDADVSLLLRFEQSTGEGRLRRRYRGWLHGPAGWTSVLSLRDTVPVPRARWRVLPGGPLRLVAARGGEIAAYRLRSGLRDVVLELGGIASSWPSPTGQRERLRRARLRSGPDTVAGLAVVRRTAHPLDGAPPDEEDGFLLLALSAEEGLVVTLPGDEAGTTTAHGRIGERSGPWDSVSVILPEGAAAGRLRLRDGSLEIELEALDEASDVPVRALRGRIVTGEERAVRGLLVRARGR